MKALVTALFLLVSFCIPASALEKFEEYRIRGNEIRSVRIGAQAEEDPVTMVIELGADAQGDQKITFESDGELDSCRAEVENIIGDANAYVQIVSHLTANTMNGVMVVQCLALRN